MMIGGRMMGWWKHIHTHTDTHLLVQNGIAHTKPTKQLNWTELNWTSMKSLSPAQKECTYMTPTCARECFFGGTDYIEMKDESLALLPLCRPLSIQAVVYINPAVLWHACFFHSFTSVSTFFPVPLVHIHFTYPPHGGTKRRKTQSVTHLHHPIHSTYSIYFTIPNGD